MKRFSTSKRKTINRDFSKNRTLMQDGHGGYGNVGIPSYYMSTHPLFDNIALYNGFANRWAGGESAAVDNNGWPINDQWQAIYGCDMVGSTGEWEPALFTDCEYGGFMIGQYKTRTQWAPGAITWHPDFGTSGRLVKDVTLDDGYTHEFVYEVYSIIDPKTGLRRRRYIGFVGKNGIGLTDLIMPRLGSTIAEATSKYVSSECIEYYRRFRGLRLMDFSHINGYEANVEVLPQNVRRFGIPSMQGDFHPSSKAVRGGWSFHSVYTDIATNQKVEDTLGIPIDLQVQFLNELHEAPGSVFEEAYLHLPIQATPETMELMLRIYAKHLNPNIKVYLELGNEVWNFSFKASSYALDKAVSLKFDPQWNLAFDGDNDLNSLRQKYLAAKATDMMLIAQRVWREEGKPITPMGVMSGQIANPLYPLVQCRMIEFRSRKKANELFVALGIAPYFGPSSTGFAPSFKGQNQSGKTKEEYLDIFRRTYLDYHDWFFPQTPGGIKYFKMIAQSFGLQLWCYEAGYDYSTMTANNGADVIAIVDALKDPEMGRIVYDFQRDAYRAGVNKLFWYLVVAGTWQRGGWNSWFQFAIQEGTRSPLTLIHKEYLRAQNTPKPDIVDMKAWNKITASGGVAKYSARVSSNRDYWRKHGDNYIVDSKVGLWFPETPEFSRTPEEATDDGSWWGDYYNADFYRFKTIAPEAPAKWVIYPVHVDEPGVYTGTLWGGGGTLMKGRVYNVIRTAGSIYLTTGYTDVPLTVDPARTIPKLNKEAIGGFTFDILKWVPSSTSSTVPSYLGDLVAKCDPAVGSQFSINPSLTPFDVYLDSGWTNIVVKAQQVIDNTSKLIAESYTCVVFWVKDTDGKYYLADSNFTKVDNIPYASTDAVPEDVREQLYPWKVLTRYSPNGESKGKRLKSGSRAGATVLQGIADYSTFTVANTNADIVDRIDGSGYVRTNSLGEIVAVVIVEPGYGFSNAITNVKGSITDAVTGEVYVDSLSFDLEADAGKPINPGDGVVSLVYEYDAFGRPVLNPDGSKKIKSKTKSTFNIGVQKIVFTRKS